VILEVLPRLAIIQFGESSELYLSSSSSLVSLSLEDLPTTTQA
jgi:hypothetical protein